MDVWHIILYASILVFFVGNIYRAVRLARTPMHLRWELYPVAHESGGRAKYGGSYLEDVDWWTRPRKSSLLGELKVMIPEILTLKAVREHQLGLWWVSYPMHLGLYLLMGAAALLILAAIGGAATWSTTVLSFAAPIAVIGYIIGTMGTLGTLLKRLFDRNLRVFSSAETFVNIFVILFMFATGLIAWLTVPATRGISHGIASGLITATPFSVGTAIGIHLAAVAVFFVYFPFTHMTHMFTKYFSYHSIRWEDKPNVPGGKMEKQIAHVLQFPVSWAGPHIKADGKKTWADLATMTGGEES